MHAGYASSLWHWYHVHVGTPSSCACHNCPAGIFISLQYRRRVHQRRDLHVFEHSLLSFVRYYENIHVFRYTYMTGLQFRLMLRAICVTEMKYLLNDPELLCSLYWLDIVHGVAYLHPLCCPYHDPHAWYAGGSPTNGRSPAGTKLVPGSKVRFSRSLPFQIDDSTCRACQ